MKSYRVADLTSDPAAYQFRANDAANGVTQAHKITAERWEPLLHGQPLIVHERLDGKTYVVDGHHRFAFAQQLAALGKGPELLHAFVLSEAQGVSVQDAKLIAAYANMAQGGTDVVDAARAFKEARDPAVHQQWLPQLQMDKSNLTLSYKLSGLSDVSLSKVQAGEVPAEAAAMVAERVKDPAKQDKVMEIIGVKLRQDYPNWKPDVGLGVALAGTSNDNKALGIFVAREMARRQEPSLGLGA